MLGWLLAAFHQLPEQVCVSHKLMCLADCLQDSTNFQSEIASATTDPLQALLLLLCPWLPKAKKNKAARQALAQVLLPCLMS